MSANNINGYVDYFRQLAVHHKDLRHNPASEMGDAPASSMHFAKWNLNELTGSLRTKCSFPVLLLELYEIDTESTQAYEIKQPAQGAITILQHVKQGEIADEQPAYALTESILFDILKQIWQDHHGPNATPCLVPFKKFDFDKLKIVTTGQILQNEMGWRCEFNFKFRNDIDITVAPTPGTFV